MGMPISGYESNLSDKDYDTLNVLIMENEDGGFLESNGKEWWS